tara:strand:- start:4160 stop:5968 length:1809 start_codon:yes stop_codon:yes gene_type:complete
MIYFKLIEEIVDADRGPVLSTALLGESTENQYLDFNISKEFESILLEPTSLLKSGDKVRLGIYTKLATSVVENLSAALEKSIIIGPTLDSLKYTTPSNDYTIYDALTNTVFTNYTTNENDDTLLLFSYIDIEDKLLIAIDHSNSDVKEFVSPTLDRAYTDYTISTSDLEIGEFRELIIVFGEQETFINGSSVEIRQNPLYKIEINPLKSEYYKKWRVQINKRSYITSNDIISTNPVMEPDVARNEYVTNEKVTLLAHNIIETKQKGLLLTSITNTSRQYNGDGFIYLYDIDGNEQNFIIEAVDKERGLILYTTSVTGGSRLRMDYTVDNSWYESSVLNFNPLFNRKTYGIYPTEGSYMNNSRLFFNRNQTGVFYSIDDDNISVYDFYVGTSSSSFHVDKDFIQLGNLSLVCNEPEYLDIRKPGGQLIDTTGYADDLAPLYDLKSHTSFGFMGISPEQLNTIIVGVSEEIIRTLIVHFDPMAASTTSFIEVTGSCTVADTISTNKSDCEDPDTNGGAGTWVPVQIATANTAELIFYAQNYKSGDLDSDGDPSETNIIELEIRDAIGRYIPVGISAVITVAESGDILYEPFPNEKVLGSVGGYV